MFTQVSENINKINNDSVESLRQATELTQKAGQTFLEMQSTWVSQAIKFGVDQAQLLSKAQDPRAYFADQATLVGDYLEQSAKDAEKFVAVVTDNGEQAREFVEQGVEKAQTNLRAVAEEATTAAKVKPAAKKKAA
jgi:predicted phage tail protein